MWKTNEKAAKRKMVKELLESAVYLRQEIAVKKEAIDDLAAMEQAVDELDGKRSVRMELTQLRDAFLKDVSALLALKGKVKRGIDMLEDRRLRIIFAAKYIKGMSWNEVADLMVYSEVHTRRLANSGYYALADSIFSDET